MDATSSPNRRLPRESEDNFRSGKAARKGLNKDWFCGQCGGYHPKARSCVTGSVSREYPH